MKVTLINYTPLALETLIFTKNTRLNMTATGLAEIVEWSMDKKLKQLEYMRNTIQSSWEFIDYIFAIEDVTRAFTHQLVRHRAGTSFAQQAQRAVDMSEFTYETGPSIEAVAALEATYEDGMEAIAYAYKKMIVNGANPQDARGILPTNIHTNIVFKANLRTLADMGLKRLCVKAQGEFQNVFRAIRQAVIDVHPWAAGFINVWCVTHGTCCFPTFPVENCPVKPAVYNPLTGKAYDGGTPSIHDHQEIQTRWETMRAEAQPTLPASDE